ncbi:Rossmann-like and DUF2520 domain-containing protein [Flavobacterium sp. H122]|uniref:Rossmann-like and DUF2520 domain-containing protein n=1 Tax=Flavobacterium sp. H122 TaxID=2529860 RepID=UPI0010AB1C61|nr:DUF2520 domain-containing protein [Flavobacterium sp. H122]
MISIVILGSGNVASHLISAFQKSNEIVIKQVFARNTSVTIPDFPKEKVIHSIDQLTDADVYIISVTDAAINELANQIPFENKFVVHTSGSMPMNILSDKNRKGVFYPLQTFTKNKEVDFKEIPICLEAENDKDFLLLNTLAGKISSKCYQIDSEQRKAIHVAAVFVCNFVNHLYQLGNEICKENNIPFEILHPLIEETANKIKTLSPQEAQTGPARRNDTVTINSHLNFLNDANKKEIYKILTKSIIDNV